VMTAKRIVFATVLTQLAGLLGWLIDGGDVGGLRLVLVGRALGLRRGGREASELCQNGCENDALRCHHGGSFVPPYDKSVTEP